MRFTRRTAALAVATTAMLVLPAHGAAAQVFFPVQGSYDYGTVENRFGDDRGDHMHEGQDIMAPAGTPLVAVVGSVVLEAGSDGGRGNYLLLYDPRGRRTFSYFHMLEPSPLTAGQRVRAGQALGRVGCTGSCWGDHLHFELHRGRDAYEGALDPLPFLRAAARQQREIERWRWPSAA
jgi:murein DD-endopeptidase MepM/ murein hydrolase activator NlpD